MIIFSNIQIALTAQTEMLLVGCLSMLLSTYIAQSRLKKLSGLQTVGSKN